MQSGILFFIKLHIHKVRLIETFQGAQNEILVCHHGNFEISFVLKVKLHPIGVLLGLEVVVVLEEKMPEVHLIICDGNIRIQVLLPFPLDKSLWG